MHKIKVSVVLEVGHSGVLEVGHSGVLEVGHSGVLEVGHSGVLEVGHSGVLEVGHSGVLEVGHSGVLEVGHSCCHKRNRLYSPSFLILPCQDYHKLFSSVTYKDESSGRDFCFEFVFSGNCQTYVVAKGNPCQVYWMWRKRETGDWTSPRTLDIQKLLDTSVYSEECLSVYERVIGDGFVTPGGLSATKVSGRGEGKGRGGLLGAFAAVVMFIDFLLLWGKVRFYPL